MAKYVKCVDNSEMENLLQIGSIYKVEQTAEDGDYKIKIGDTTCWFIPQRFTVMTPESNNEPITFASQQEFEDAVMAVVMERLRVYNYVESPTGGGREEYLNIKDGL